MSIVTCSNCKMRVIANADGHCPSCRVSLIGAEDATKPASPTVPVVAIAPTTQHVALPPERVGRTVNDDRPTHFDVFWVLFSFRGRIPRSVFWIATIIGPVVLYFVFGLTSGLMSEPSTLLVLIDWTIFCAILSMSLAIGVKRLHDLNWSGWLILIWLIPALGQILMLFTAGMMRGTRGLNIHGPDPLELLN